MKIFLATGHGGFEYKKKLLNLLNQQGYEVIDCGNTLFDPKDDYPDFVNKLAKLMATEPNSYGVVMCRNGIGACIATNRHIHLRCGLCFNKTHVKSARQDDNINVLAIPADYLKIEQVVQIVNTFLDTPFSNHERHNRRLAKINQLTSKV